MMNSVIASGMDWYARNFHQCRAVVLAQVESETEEVEDHPVLELLRRPTPGIAASTFWMWMHTDYKLFGNAYARKVRAGGMVVALQYLPQDMVAPNGDGEVPLTHYTYRPDGREFKIPVEDVIHWRYGRDPLDIRIGRSPLQSALREVATDNAASTAAFGLLRNGAMPSIIIGPDGKDTGIGMSAEEARGLKRQVRADFTGDNAGGVAVLSEGFKMERVSLTPDELALDSVRMLPEERICATLGVNPMVLGLGSGLERSTYSNFERAQQAAWEDGMIPLVRSLAEILTESLLPEYGDDTSLRVDFDLSEVRALQDDMTVEAARAVSLFANGLADRAEAKRIAGLTPEEEDDDLLHPLFASLGKEVDAEGNPVEDTASMDSENSDTGSEDEEQDDEAVDKEVPGASSKSACCVPGGARKGNPFYCFKAASSQLSRSPRYTA
jgi:HK97 family phage portal protein